MSAEMVTSPIWQIFTPEQIDLSTVEKEWVEYREVNVTNLESLTKLEIETRDRDSFILPHEGYLEVRFYITQQNGAGNIPLTDSIALQNNALTLFKNMEYMIEDQRIEYLDEPGMAFTIKNLTDFSKQYGESIASNQHFYIDTQDAPTFTANVRFFNNANPVAPIEVFFTVNGTGNAVPTVPANAPNGASIIATVNGTPVVFRTDAALFGTVARTLVMDAGVLALPNDGNGGDNHYVTAYVDGMFGAQVTFLANNVAVFPQQNGAAAAIRPIDGFGVNGSVLTGVAFQNGMYNSVYNSGFSKRSVLASNSNIVSCWIPFKDMFLFCRAYDKISRGLRHKLVFNKNSDNQMLLRSGGADRSVLIEYLSAWIPRLKPNLETLKMVESKLISNYLMYTVNFTDLTYWRTPIPIVNNANNVAYQLATTTKKPIRVWVAFQNTTRVNDSQTINKRVFDHVNTSAIQVRLNGKIFPLYEYKFEDNFTNYNRAYVAFLNSGYKMADHSDGSLITYEMFKSLYPIFYFDLTAQEEDLYKAHKYAELEVRFSNSAPNGSSYHMHVVYESERVIKFRGIGGSMALEM